jgi:hypothetical protein
MRGAVRRTSVKGIADLFNNESGQQCDQLPSPRRAKKSAAGAQYRQL